MVDTLTAERSAVVRVPRSMTPAGSGPPTVDALPVMPSDLQDLEQWLLDHADLRDAGVCRLWFRRHVDGVVGARCGEVSRNVRGWRRRHVVAFSTRTLLKDSWFRVVLLYGLGGSRRGGVESGSHTAVGRISASDTPQRQVASNEFQSRPSKRFGCGSCAQCCGRLCSCSAESPHVIADVVKSDLQVGDAGLLAQSARVQSVPVFDPLEFDEEDELDALSRNVTGVSAIGHAVLQGPTLVDSDDELMAPVVVPVFDPADTGDEDEGRFPMVEVCGAPTLAVYHGRCAVLASPVASCIMQAGLAGGKGTKVGRWTVFFHFWTTHR